MKIALDGNGRFHGIVIGVFLALTPGQPLSRDRYFKEDYYSSAQYLKLSVDGRYEIVDRHHAGVWVTDRGRWLVEGDGTFLFESDHRIRSIVAPVGGVSFSGTGAASLVASLRIKLTRILDGYSTQEPIATTQIALEETSDAGHARVELAPAVQERGMVSRQEIQSLLNAMDRYLLSELRGECRRRLESYRAVTFLVSSGCGGGGDLDTRKIRSRIDELDGEAPADLLVEVTRDVFEREIRMAYPFRFAR